MRVGKITSIENGPKRDVDVRITPDRLFSEISIPPGEVIGANVSGIRVVEERIGGNDCFHLYLETLQGAQVLFYTAATKFDVALLLDELEASLGNKLTRAWVKAEPKKRISKIVFGSVIALFVLLMLAIIVPSLPRYDFTSVTEARAFAHIEGAEIVDELGDTNGPYRLKGSSVSGRDTFGKNFDFDLTFNGHTTNWNRLVSSNTWYVATIFENRRGNQFAVVSKRTE